MYKIVETFDVSVTVQIHRLLAWYSKIGLAVHYIEFKLYNL